MARPAGPVILHVGHGIALALGSAGEYSAVAVGTAVDVEMEGMAEKCIRFLERDVLRGSPVTLSAIACHREGALAIVTSATRLPVLHLGHRMALPVRPCNKKPRMAIAALEHFQMKVVTEKGLGWEVQVLHAVALCAVLLDGESGTPVMAGAAGHPTLHLLHGHVRVAGTGLEYLVVALRTAVHPEVKFVAEDNGAEIGYIDRDFLNDVTAGAFGERKGACVAVACAAGLLVLLHLGHGDRGIFLYYVENCVVALGAVFGKFAQVNVMVEEYLSGVRGNVGNGLELLGEDEAGKYRKTQKQDYESLHHNLQWNRSLTDWDRAGTIPQLKPSWHE